LAIPDGKAVTASPGIALERSTGAPVCRAPQKLQSLASGMVMTAFGTELGAEMNGIRPGRKLQ
jgi:hypothetical protein